MRHEPWSTDRFELGRACAFKARTCSWWTSSPAGSWIFTGQVRAVAPGFDAQVMAASEAAGLPHLPGVATPSDIQGVLKAGGHWVKAFPATALGTEWFRAMRGPFPDVRIVATGGMDDHNAREYLGAGARMVAVGSALADPEQIPLLAELL